MLSLNSKRNAEREEDNARGKQKSNSQDLVNRSIHVPGYHLCAALDRAYRQSRF